MKKIYCYLLLCLGAFTGHAQHGCDGSRYIQDVFGAPDIQTNVTYCTGNGALLMDIYTPAGDVETDRPVIILAHGGSFIAGQKEDMGPICVAYAKKGYVVATMQYRLTDALNLYLQDSLFMKDVVVKAMNDMRAAVRFFKEDAANGNTYGIDPNLVFVGGLSAGSFCAMHTGFITNMGEVPSHLVSIMNNNGGLEGNSSSNGATYNSQVAGIINMSGAMDDVSYISAGDPAIISMHSDGDQTVPYMHAQPLGLSNLPYTYGSYFVHQQAQSVGVESTLFMVPDADVADPNHAEVYQTSNLDTLLKYSSIMMEDIVCNGGGIQGLDEEELSSKLTLYPNPVDQMLHVNIDSRDEHFTISILDITGKEVVDSQQMFSSITVDVSQLPKGIYLAKVTGMDSGLTGIKRVVVE